MLTQKRTIRPANFTFMMIDQWSTDTAYDTWDIRNVYKPQLINQDYERYIQWLDIRKKLFYCEGPLVLIASYNLGFQQDLKLFSQTFSYFHHVSLLDKDNLSINYLKKLNDQVTGNHRERSRTLNKYFIDDKNLLILEPEALQLVLKRENITSVVVMGQSWESCVKNRPVGLKNLNLAVCDYYLIPELCYKWNGERMTEQDLIDCTETRWVKCEDFNQLEFELIKTNTDMAERENISMYKLVEILK